MLAALPWYGVLSLTWDGFAEAVFTQRSSKNGEWRTFMLDDSSDLPTAVRGGSRLFLRPAVGAEHDIVYTQAHLVDIAAAIFRMV